MLRWLVFFLGLASVNQLPYSRRCIVRRLCYMGVEDGQAAHDARYVFMTK